MPRYSGHTEVVSSAKSDGFTLFPRYSGHFLVVVDEDGHAGVVGGGTVAVVGVGYSDTVIAAVLIVVTLLKVLTRFLWHLRNVLLSAKSVGFTLLRVTCSSRVTLRLSVGSSSGITLGIVFKSFSGGVTDDGTHIDFLIRRGNWFFVRSGKFILLLLST